MSDQAESKVARKARVAAASNIIFASLMKAIEERLAKHSNDFTTNTECHSTIYAVTISRNTTPNSTLKIAFPTNSGAMQIRLSGENATATIELDITDRTPVFLCADGSRASVDGFVDEILGLILAKPDGSL